MPGALKALLMSMAQGQGPIARGFNTGAGMAMSAQQMRAKEQADRLRQSLMQAKLGFQQQKHSDTLPIEQQRAASGALTAQTALGRLRQRAREFGAAPGRTVFNRATQLAPDFEALVGAAGAFSGGVPSTEAARGLQAGHRGREVAHKGRVAGGQQAARETAKTRELSRRRLAEKAGTGVELPPAEKARWEKLRAQGRQPIVEKPGAGTPAEVRTQVRAALAGVLDARKAVRAAKTDPIAKAGGKPLQVLGAEINRAATLLQSHPNGAAVIAKFITPEEKRLGAWVDLMKRATRTPEEEELFQQLSSEFAPAPKAR